MVLNMYVLLRLSVSARLSNDGSVLYATSRARDVSHTDHIHARPQHQYDQGHHELPNATRTLLHVYRESLI